MGPVRARVVTRRLDRTRITALEATAHRRVVHPRIGSAQDEPAQFTFTLAGTTIGDTDGRPTRDVGDSVRFVGIDTTSRSVVPGPPQAVSWWVHLSDLQPEVAATLRHASPFDLNDDAGTRGAISIIRAILDIAPEPGSSDARALEGVLIGLIEAAVLSADANRIAPGEPPAAS